MPRREPVGARSADSQKVSAYSGVGLGEAVGRAEWLLARIRYPGKRSHVAGTAAQPLEAMDAMVVDKRWQGTHQRSGEVRSSVVALVVQPDAVAPWVTVSYSWRNA